MGVPPALDPVPHRTRTCAPCSRLPEIGRPTPPRSSRPAPTAAVRSSGAPRSSNTTRSGTTGCSLFYEYFHGDNGARLGASHQTGILTPLVARIIQIGAYLRPDDVLSGALNSNLVYRSSRDVDPHTWIRPASQLIQVMPCPVVLMSTAAILAVGTHTMYAGVNDRMRAMAAGAPALHDDDAVTLPSAAVADAALIVVLPDTSALPLIGLMLVAGSVRPSANAVDYEVE